jgi:protein ImuB
MFWYALCLRDLPSHHSGTLEQLAIRALRFTPAVCIEPAIDRARFAAADGSPALPSGLLLEAGSSLRLFGGHESLLRKLRNELADAGHAASIGWAPNPAAAWAFARWRDGSGCIDPAELPETLAALPVALLESADRQVDLLASVGLRCVADLLALPRAGLARRFGQPLLDELDRLHGCRPDPRRWYEAPSRFDFRLELPAQIESAPALLFAARGPVAQLALWLEALCKAARGFEFVIEHDDDLPETSLALGLAEPSWQTERLLTLLRERLAVTRLPAPARGLRLHCHDIDDAAPPSGSLFPDPAAAIENLAPLVERLQARLGRRQVQHLRSRPDHRPEAAWQACEADVALLRRAPRGQAQQPRQVATLPRPLWLLESPLALNERNGRPFWHGPLALLAGPERIESGWWDALSVQRDYFVAEDPSHRLLWIYRERPSATDARQGWFLHGRFG